MRTDGETFFSIPEYTELVLNHIDGFAERYAVLFVNRTCRSLTLVISHRRRHLEPSLPIFIALSIVELVTGMLNRHRHTLRMFTEISLQCLRARAESDVLDEDTQDTLGWMWPNVGQYSIYCNGTLSSFEIITRVQVAASLNSTRAIATYRRRQGASAQFDHFAFFHAKEQGCHAAMSELWKAKSERERNYYDHMSTAVGSPWQHMHEAPGGSESNGPVVPESCIPENEVEIETLLHNCMAHTPPTSHKDCSRVLEAIVGGL
jgi:hypothetical protein